MLRTEIDFAGGRVLGDRASQQDFYAFASPEDLGGGDNLLLAVADGMGGHAAGQLASRTAVEAFFDSYFESRLSNERDRMVEGAHHANQCLARLASQNPAELRGMGTTLVAVRLDGARLWWTSVGDSLLYLYRGKSLRRLNAEHSMRPVLQERVARGEISAAEAEVHPERNHLFAALNGEPLELIDAPSEPFELENEDVLLACSDGVLTLDEERVGRTLEIYKTEDAKEIVGRLLRDISGRRKPKQDNTTVAAIKIGARAGSPQGLPAV